MRRKRHAAEGVQYRSLDTKLWGWAGAPIPQDPDRMADLLARLEAALERNEIDSVYPFRPILVSRPALIFRSVGGFLPPASKGASKQRAAAPSAAHKTWPVYLEAVEQTRAS